MTSGQLIDLIRQADPTGNATVVVLKPGPSLEWMAALDLIATPANGNTPDNSIGITSQGA